MEDVVLRWAKLSGKPQKAAEVDLDRLQPNVIVVKVRR
jgi:hypothetical protein